MDRPGWSKLEADVRSGGVARVVCWRIDRLGRTAKWLTALFDELRQRRGNLVSLRDGVDLSTPAGQCLPTCSRRSLNSTMRCAPIESVQARRLREGQGSAGVDRGQACGKR